MNNKEKSVQKTRNIVNNHVKKYKQIYLCIITVLIIIFGYVSILSFETAHLNRTKNVTTTSVLTYKLDDKFTYDKGNKGLANKLNLKNSGNNLSKNKIPFKVDKSAGLPDNQIYLVPNDFKLQSTDKPKDDKGYIIIKTINTDKQTLVKKNASIFNMSTKVINNNLIKHTHQKTILIPLNVTDNYIMGKPVKK